MVDGTEFSTGASLEVYIDQQSLRNAKRDLEQSMGSVTVPVEASGAGAAATGATSSTANQLVRQMDDNLGLNRNRNELLRDIYEELDDQQSGGGGGGDGFRGRSRNLDPEDLLVGGAGVAALLAGGAAASLGNVNVNVPDSIPISAPEIDVPDVDVPDSIPIEFPDLPGGKDPSGGPDLPDVPTDPSGVPLPDFSDIPDEAEKIIGAGTAGGAAAAVGRFLLGGGSGVGGGGPSLPSVGSPGLGVGPPISIPNIVLSSESGRNVVSDILNSTLEGGSRRSRGPTTASIASGSTTFATSLAQSIVGGRGGQSRTRNTGPGGHAAGLLAAQNSGGTHETTVNVQPVVNVQGGPGPGLEQKIDRAMERAKQEVKRELAQKDNTAITSNISRSQQGRFQTQM